MVTMLGLRPWQPDESVPRLAPPTTEARVGNAVAVPTVGPAVAVVEAAVAPGKAQLVSRPDKGASEGEGPEGGLAVGPALAVAVSAGKEVGGRKVGEAPEPTPLPASSPPAAPVAVAPAPELASVPATPPSSSPPAKTPNGPVAVGSPGSPLEEEVGKEEGTGSEKACAGDEYTLTITSPAAEGEAFVIVLEHLVADGSTEMLELEGDLEDARNLVLRLSSEGGCVEVEVVPPGDGVEEPASQPSVTP